MNLRFLPFATNSVSHFSLMNKSALHYHMESLMQSAVLSDVTVVKLERVLLRDKDIYILVNRTSNSTYSVQFLHFRVGR